MRIYLLYKCILILKLIYFKICTVVETLIKILDMVPRWKYSHSTILQKSREIGIFCILYICRLYFSLVCCFEDLRRFGDISAKLWFGSRRYPISEIVVVILGIESRASCSASKSLTTTPSLFQSAWQHNSITGISVNHARQVSGFCKPPPPHPPLVPRGRQNLRKIDHVSGFLRIYMLFHLKVTKSIVLQQLWLNPSQLIGIYLLKMTTEDSFGNCQTIIIVD